jgi:hypothetical protein
MICIEQQHWYERPLRTRIPFRYGIAVMTDVPHVWLDLEVTMDGKRVTGRAADHLPPKWFTKEAARAVAEEIEEMREVLRQASRHAQGLEAKTVPELIEEVYRRQAAWARERRLPALLANFGPSLVERALLDAACRARRQTLAQLILAPGFGLQLGHHHPSLSGTTLAAGLPVRPLERVIARHTVGLGDPLGAEDASAEERPADDLPAELPEVIAAYQLRHFKIKVAEGPGGLERLERVVAVVERETNGHYAATLDGNETFQSVASLREFWAHARERRGLRSLWERLLFVEQPFARSLALGDEVARELPAWSDRPPLLIDESGAEPADLRRALAIGYVGVSHKNCKGVLHGVANACLLAQWRRERPEAAVMMSGEDLCNVGPVALPQDLAVQALLGNESVERNGHHYFAGLSAWPESVQDYVQQAYPSLYDCSKRGWPTLRVEQGAVDLREVNQTAFGGESLAPMSSGLSPWFSC